MNFGSIFINHNNTENLVYAISFSSDRIFDVNIWAEWSQHPK
jgi:hypothetical protein